MSRARAAIEVAVGRRASRVFWRLILLLCLLAYGAAVAGQRLSSPPGTSVGLYDWMNYAYAAIGVFGVLWEFPLLSELDENSHWLLHASRWLGPAAAASTILWLLFGRLRTNVALLVCSARPPAVVCLGFGRDGQALATILGKVGESTIAVNDQSTTEATDFCERAGITLFLADPTDTDTLRHLPIHRARMIVVASGSDAKNLQIASRLEAALPRSAGSNRPDALYINVSDPLLQRTLRDSGLAASFEMVSVSNLAAQDLLVQAQFGAIARERGQTHVHVVLDSPPDHCLEALSAIAQTSVRSDLNRPVVSVMTGDVATTVEYLSRHMPGIGDWVTIHVEAHPHSSPAFMHDDLARLMERGRITGFVVTTAGDEHAMSRAIGIYALASSSDEVDAPVFLVASGLSVRLARARARSESSRIGGCIESVGETRTLADRSVSGLGSDTLARLLHEGYLSRIDVGSDLTESPAQRPWFDLGGTYREANRRAAAHVPVKLRQAGFAPLEGVRKDVDGIRIDFRAAAMALGRGLEALANSEHIRWCVDRAASGWRAGGQRDDARRIHPLLKPYPELNEFERERDRALVADAFTAVATRDVRRVTWVPEITIGVAGSLFVSREHALASSEEINEMLLGLKSKLPFAFRVAVMSPGAPGADTELAWVVLKRLEGLQIPHRLVLLEAAPRSRTEADWTPHVKDRASYMRDLAKLEKSARWVVPLHHRWPPGRFDPSLSAHRRRAYRLASAYLATRADVLVIAPQQSTPGNPGGSHELIEWRNSLELVPEEYRVGEGAQWLSQTLLV